MNPIFDNLFIFEMANNHQGSVEHGLKIVREMAKIARRHKVRAAVKFQYRHLNTMIHPDYRDREDVKHIPRFLSTRLSEEEFLTMADAVRNEGMVLVVTPFDEKSVGLCMDHGVEIMKVASCSATDWPLLDAISETRRPTIVSTGGLSIYDIDNLVSFFRHRHADLALLHCVARYPVPNESLHMNFLNKLARRYPDVPIGYSGHEAPDNLDVVKIAVSKGARLFERHVGVPTETIKLNAYSMNPEQVDAWVGGAVTAHTICGVGYDRPIEQDEIDSLLSLKRGVFAAHTIRKGARLASKDVFFAMPCREGQLTSGDFGQKRASYTASKDYAKGAPIEEFRQTDPMIMVRSIIHDAKGMIYEAGVPLGKDVEVELSHHYGIQHFRQTGALIVSVVNREYCKKIIVLLPGQENPTHCHKLKEETFHVLSGDLVIVVNGIEHVLRRGEKIVVERGSWHSFKSVKGCVFEEISTTHRRGDSYYQDEQIAALDPMQRKTVVDEW